MADPTREPAPNEPLGTIQFSTQPSSALILAVLASAAAVIGAMFALFIARQDLALGRRISLFVFLAVLAAVLVAIHHVKSTRYLVTDRFVIAHAGLFEDRTEQLPIDEIGTIEVDEALHRRVFGMGDVRLEPSDPDRPPVRFRFVANPHTVRARTLAVVEGEPPGGTQGA